MSRRRRGWEDGLCTVGLNGMINERCLQRVLSLLWTSRDTTGSPLVTRTHTALTHANTVHTKANTLKSTHTHTHLKYPSPLTLSLTMVGQWDRGAIITNTTQRLGVFTVHELDVTRHAADAAVACADFLIRLLFHTQSLANI